MADQTIIYDKYTLAEQKKAEYLAALLVQPFIKLKNEKFRPNEIIFFASWLLEFKEQEVKARKMKTSMFSHATTNYEMLNHLVRLGLIDRTRRGYYKLSQKTQDALHKIRQQISKEE